MNKNGKALAVTLLIILLAILGVALWFLYQNLPGSIEELKPVNGIGDEDIGGSGNYNTGEFEQSQQFYPNMRFADKRITYSISSECNDVKESEVDEAFGIIESNTVLSFVKTQDSGLITIFCSEDAPEPKEKGHFVAGEGGPTEVINTSLYAVILSGQLSLYRDDKCDTAHIALHEALHVLGFDHNDNPGSILYPTLDCNQEVDDYFWQEIDRIYEKEGLADLKIKHVAATKSGRYLNFEIEVVNQGLKPVTSAKLRVYGDDKVIEFKDAETGKDRDYLDLEEVEVGTTKIFTVDNARLSGRGVEEIKFVVDGENEIQELFEDNNVIVLSV